MGGGAGAPTCTVSTPAARELKGTKTSTATSSPRQPTSIRFVMIVISDSKLQRGGGEKIAPTGALPRGRSHQPEPVRRFSLKGKADKPLPAILIPRRAEPPKKKRFESASKGMTAAPGSVLGFKGCRGTVNPSFKRETQAPRVNRCNGRQQAALGFSWLRSGVGLRHPVLRGRRRRSCKGRYPQVEQIARHAEPFTDALT